MSKTKIILHAAIGGMCLIYAACAVPSHLKKAENKTVPGAFSASRDSSNTAKIKWKTFFKDQYLTALIDTALKHNQELNVTLMEIEVAKNEVRARRGSYLPYVGIQAGAGVDKAARYTNIGAMEANTDITPGQAMPEPVPNLFLGAYANWELDIWSKLRNSKRAAAAKYLSTVEGKNFMVTNLVSEIASSYYELLALDNQLEIVKQNIEIQTNAFEIVKMEKEATRVTELAVRRFEAQVLNTRSLQYGIQQKIVETENKINFLLGRFPQPIPRNAQSFSTLLPDTVYAGLPSQLLLNRPDIRQAELDLVAAKLDVKSARANFYPSLNLSAGLGYQAFNAAYFIKTPASLLYTVAGDLVAPLINRSAIKATYYTANAKQVQAAYNYERTILSAYVEVVNQLSKISNVRNSFMLKEKQVEALNQSVIISNNLFKSARADYMEVLLTQRDALESRIELIETRMQQMNAMVKMYQALGGGWN
ncbi:MAG: efflux transporter outer membrane subunit [Bacteroidia bacterium]|nr:efflux transporter outer membrane subunit [Bacteroidia bacterium]